MRFSCPEASTTLLQGCLDRLNAGDPAARDELIRHSYGRLQRLAHHMLQDFVRLQRRQEADDVLQNALLRLLRALETVPLDSVREFFRLAATQLRRKLLDLARHHFGPEGSGTWRADPEEGAARKLPEPGIEASADRSTDPARLAHWTDFHQQVEALPAEEREVFGLLWYHSLTQAEAAAVLNVSESTVKRWWLSARLRLQEALHGDGPVS